MTTVPTRAVLFLRLSCRKYCVFEYLSYALRWREVPRRLRPRLETSFQFVWPGEENAFILPIMSRPSSGSSNPSEWWLLFFFVAHILDIPGLSMSLRVPAPPLSYYQSS